jgi:transcriptional regulator with XRE-family HTH domain
LALRKTCANIPHVDKVTLGRRLAEARDLAGMTQESVARAVGLDRTAIVLLEKGDRNLKVPELVQIAQILGRPLSYFVEPPVPAAVNRRSAPAATHDSTRALDVEIDQFAVDVRGLLATGLLAGATRPDTARAPRTHLEAERAAAAFRNRIELGSAPINDLGRTCEALGLYTYAVGLGEAGPDGGCVEVTTDSSVVGAAVINGDVGSGRRRMTLAHELGHWLFGDAYDKQASLDNERMISSFAVHFLAPRAGVTKVWSERSNWSLRDRALAVGVEYRLSWSATISQLRNLELISHEDRTRLSAGEPKSGDYLRLGLSWNDELAAPYLSPTYIAACLTGYTDSSLTEAKVLELLRGVVGHEDLPQVEPATLSDLRQAFRGHAGIQLRD